MEWQTIESAPKGPVIMVWATCYEWPEVVRWEEYTPEEAKDAGVDGYWRYADDLLADVTESCGDDGWTHWMPVPDGPQ